MSPTPPRARDQEDDSPLLRAYFEKRGNLVMFLAARTGSMATAEDLVQDLYLKLTARDQPLKAEAPVALLYRMAANLLVDHVRSLQRSARRSALWRQGTRTDVDGREVSQEPAADDALIGRERLHLLAEAVSELPPQMQRAFRLHKLEGLTQAQTAQAMGVSVKAVEQHIQAAIRGLARRLQA